MYTAGRNYKQTYLGKIHLSMNSYKLTTSMFVDFWKVARHRITEKKKMKNLNSKQH